MSEGIQLPDYEGLWEEAPIPMDMVKTLAQYVGSARLVLYRRIPYGPIPELAEGDRVSIVVKDEPRKTIYGDTMNGFVIREVEDDKIVLAHGSGEVSTVAKDAVEYVLRNGQEIWRRSKAA
jgi:hypothetical protein